MKTYAINDASDLEIQNLRSRQANLCGRQKKHQESIDNLLSRAQSFPESYFALHDGSAVVRLEQLRREMDHIVSDRIRCTTRQMAIHDEVVSPLVRQLSTRICQTISFDDLAVQLIDAARDADKKLVDAEVSFEHRISDWQNRALEPMYPIVFLDALRVKIRDAESRQVKNKAVYVALGVTPEGEREVLGLWIAANEGAKFWLSIMNNLKNRGLEDILIAVVDGLKGFPDAINAAFPDTPDAYQYSEWILRKPASVATCYLGLSQSV